jgi:hypothetical protein
LKRGDSLDLFTVTQDQEKLHPNFRAILEENSPYLREKISSWALGFKDRDNKFVNEFQTTFNSSFWELYLFAVLKHLNLTVDFSYESPDFLVKGNNNFCIEATTANHPVGGQAEWERSYSIDELKNWSKEKMINNATVRLANAFISKSNKYLKSYKNLKHVSNNAFVLAIAPFDSPYFFLQNHQAIRRVLYGFDRYKAIDWNNEEREIIEEINFKDIAKPNGSKVPLGYFNSLDYSHISAVIFSSIATVGKARLLSDDPRLILASYKKYNDLGTQPIYEILEKGEAKEHLLDGLTVFHNPYATIPFNAEEFYEPKIGHVDNTTSDIPHLFTFQREVVVIRNSGKWSIKRKKQHEILLKEQLFKKQSLESFPIIHE